MGTEIRINLKESQVKTVLQVLLEDAVDCGYECWIPSCIKSIAKRGNLPVKTTEKILHCLKDKGYVEKEHYGGVHDDGTPYCTHGWSLTRKWIEENSEKYHKAQQAEYEKIDQMLKDN